MEIRVHYCTSQHLPEKAKADVPHNVVDTSALIQAYVAKYYSFAAAAFASSWQRVI